MKVLLNPKDNENLKALYNRAFKRAEEIYIATAFFDRLVFFSKAKEGLQEIRCSGGNKFWPDEKGGLSVSVGLASKKFARKCVCFPVEREYVSSQGINLERTKGMFCLNRFF